MNTYELLEQDRYWRTRDGLPILLTHMGPDHRRNTLNYLRRNASFTRRAYDWCVIFNRAEDDDQPHMDIRPQALDSGAEDWINARPFMIELQRLVTIDQSVILDSEPVLAEIGISCHELTEHEWVDETHEHPRYGYVVPAVLSDQVLQVYMSNAGATYRPPNARLQLALDRWQVAIEAARRSYAYTLEIE